MRTIRFFLPAALYYGLIYFLSDQPQIPISFVFPLQDKFFHFVIYAGFGVCLLYGLARIDRLGTRRRLGTLVVIGVLAAGLDEFHQAYVPGRNADIVDAAADVLGILAGWLIVRLLIRSSAGRRWFSAGSESPPRLP
ncbi:MAG: VanZ family protein [Candidatus Aminicenantes bacterium]|nr:VanZ family protein [Candidatus Aminicenantes bacterium]